MRVIEKVTVGKRGDGSLIRVEGQPNWFSLICVRGKQHEISTGTPDLKLAKRFHRQKLDEMAADRQGLKQFTTPQHRQLEFGSLLDDLVSDYSLRRVKSLGSALCPGGGRRGEASERAGGREGRERPFRQLGLYAAYARTAARVAEKLDWVREGAGARFADVELSLVASVSVTEARHDRARGLLAERGWSGVGVEDVLGMPSVFSGSVDRIADDMRARRERFGISYYVVSDRLLETMAPVVARLAGR